MGFKRNLFCVFQLLVVGYILCFIIGIKFSIYNKFTTIVKFNSERTHSRPMEQLWLARYYHHKRRSPHTVYPRDYDLTYNKSSVNICQGGENISILFMVHTSPSHFKQRSSIRRTFANQTYFPDNEIRVIFLIGATDAYNTQLEIEKELTTFGDIVQGYFHDSYNNLTLKAVTGLKWIAENCPNVSLVAKIDDDTFVETYRLLEDVMPMLPPRHVICNLWTKDTMPVLRSGKWKVADDELKRYGGFPWQYCSGFVVVMSGDLIPLLYKAVLTSPFLWVDDVYLTGILMSRIKNIEFDRVQFDVNTSLDPEKTKKCYSEPGCQYLFALSKTSEMDFLWKRILVIRNNKTNKAELISKPLPIATPSNMTGSKLIPIAKPTNISTSKIVPGTKPSNISKEVKSKLK